MRRRKIQFYTALFTLFLWLGGILPAAHSQNVEADNGVATSAEFERAGDLAAHHGEEEHAEGGGGLLDPQWGPYLWQLILFLVVLVVLGKFVWPPILKGLQQREGKIRSDLERAEQASREAAATLEQYRVQLADAQKEAQRIIEESRANAQRVAQQVQEQAQADVTQLRQRAEADLNAAKEQAIAEIYEQTATLATQVAGRILKREIRPEDQQALVRESLDELATTGV